MLDRNVDRPLVSSPLPRLTSRPGRRGGLDVLGGGLLGLLVLVLAGGSLLVRVADAVVPRTRVVAIEEREGQAGPVAEPRPEHPTEAALTGVRDVLVVGLDSREGLTEEQLLALGTEDNGSRLTDTLLWVQVDARRQQVRMVSFPRDLAVTPDGAPRVKLNALHALGGPDLLVSTLEQLVGEDLDHYVEVDLAGFIRLADALDGVPVCLDERMVDVYAGVDLPEGCRELSATQAAGFVRARNVVDEFGGGTAGRAARQQYFVRQAVAEAVSSATLTSPARLRGLVGLARDAVVVDAGFSTTELLRFASSLRTVDPDRLVGVTVPFTSRRFDDGLYYDEVTDEADELFAAMRSGTGLPTALVTDGR